MNDIEFYFCLFQVFGFFASILFAVEVIQQIIHHKRELMTSKQEVTQTEVTEFNPNDL